MLNMLCTSTRYPYRWRSFRAGVDALYEGPYYTYCTHIFLSRMCRGTGALFSNRVAILYMNGEVRVSAWKYAAQPHTIPTNPQNALV